MPIKEVLNLEGDNNRDTIPLGGVLFCPIQELPFKDKILLYRQASSNDNVNEYPYVIVLGFKVSEFYKKGELSAVKVHSVPKKEREEIIQILKKQVSGIVSFWD